MTEAEQSKLNCTVKIEESGPWKKKINVVIPREEVDKELDGQYKEFCEEAAIPGFRKGRAPRRLIEKRFSDDVRSQAKLRLLAQAFDQIDEEEDFEILGEPDFEPDKVVLPEEGDFVFEYEVEVKPQFELPKLEGIKVEKPLVDVNDEAVDNAIKTLCERRGSMENITDEPAIDDDMVIAAVEMKVEGIDEPETTDETGIRVGRAVVMGVLVEDMDKTLKGAKIGDVKTCSATVSDTNPKEEYRNKKADFTITVNEIRRLKPAELNEEFLQSLGVADEAELRRQVEDSLEDQAERQQRDAMRNEVYKYLDESISFDLPEGVASRFAQRVLQRRFYELMQQGVPGERLKENLEQLKAASSDQANRELKMSFIMEAVAEKLDISITEGEVNSFIAQAAMYYGRRPEKMRDEMQREGRLDSLRDQIRDEKAIDKLLENAEVVDAPAEDGKKTAKKTAKKTEKASDDAKKAEKTDADEGDDESSSTSARKQVKRKPPTSDSK